jgi:hypothetical protein
VPFRGPRAREILQEVIEGRVPPRSVNQIERQMGLGQGNLLYSFRYECRMVSAQYRAISIERSKQRVAQECAEVQLVTRTLYEQAIFPTYKQVRARLSNPNLMRRPEVRASWHTARRELGLEG